MPTEMALPTNDPRLIAWNVYKATEEFQNTRRWALREEHVDGSLWAAFLVGCDWRADARRQAEHVLSDDQREEIARLVYANQPTKAVEYVASLVAQAVQVKADQIHALHTDLRWAHGEIARLKDGFAAARIAIKDDAKKELTQAVRAERERCAQMVLGTTWPLEPEERIGIAEALRREPKEPSDG